MTSAIALKALAPLSEGEIHNDRLLKVADGCEQMRRAFEELRLPSPGEWRALGAGQTSGTVSPLTKILHDDFRKYMETLMQEMP